LPRSITSGAGILKLSGERRAGKSDKKAGCGGGNGFVFEGLRCHAGIGQGFGRRRRKKGHVRGVNAKSTLKGRAHVDGPGGTTRLSFSRTRAFRDDEKTRQSPAQCHPPPPFAPRAHWTRPGLQNLMNGCGRGRRARGRYRHRKTPAAVLKRGLRGRTVIQPAEEQTTKASHEGGPFNRT